MKIIQMIPPGEWFALFSTSLYTDSIQAPLVCWALVEEGDRRFITGMVVDDDGYSVTPCGTWRNGMLGYFLAMPDDSYIQNELRIIRELREENPDDI